MFKDLNESSIYSSLWHTDYGLPKKIEERFNNNHFFCNVVKQNIVSFCYGLNECNPDRARVIVGHCPQHFSTKNRTFNDIKNEGNIVEIIDGSIYEGTVDVQNFKVFGISMECNIENKKNDAHLYHLDVGVKNFINKYRHLASKDAKCLYLFMKFQTVFKLSTIHRPYYILSLSVIIYNMVYECL